MAGANDERMAHLMRAMNRLLDKHPQSRRRHLAWHTPIIVPVWPQVHILAFVVSSRLALGPVYSAVVHLLCTSCAQSKALPWVLLAEEPSYMTYNSAHVTILDALRV